MPMKGMAREASYIHQCRRQEGAGSTLLLSRLSVSKPAFRSRSLGRPIEGHTARLLETGATGAPATNNDSAP